MRRNFYIQFTCFFIALVALVNVPSNAQSLDKLKKQAMNTSQLSLTSGDSILVFNVLASGERTPKEELDKRYWWYGSSKLHSTQGGYFGNLLNGSFILRNSSGDLLEKGQLVKGLRTGEWRSWHAGGTIKGVYDWQEGQLHGNFKEFWPGGQLRREGRFKEGKLQGKVKEYDAEGRQTFTRYRDGEGVTAKEKKEPKRSRKVKEALQKAGERAQKLNPLKKKAKNIESRPEGDKNKKRVSAEEQHVNERKQRLFLKPFRKKDKVANAPQG